ncbi:MAG: four helix bundle protein [Alphaproteobacteria bacterium]|nr:four helix bundle protein [Alphaproteobacteria bacterium]MCD8525871.1 four helix bundle protein [Alphaproteobacteria bacterium]MCD8570730.1 four helix bundle protein [Alphaproteobacteria bacterium]
MIGLADDQKVSPLIRHYHDLDVYKKSFAISLEIHKASLEFPKIEQYGLAGQIRRASKSICANIAEGFAKQQNSKPEFRRFLLIALGSSHEMKVWIDYCRELEYVESAICENWTSEYEAISKMLQSFINKIDV